MPCFHFNLRNDRPHAHSGLELKDMQAARVEAARLAGALMAHDAERFWEEPGWRLDVTDCDDQLLFAIEITVRDGDPGAEPSDACPAHRLMED